MFSAVRRSIALFALVTLAACGKKESPPPAPAAPPPAASSVAPMANAEPAPSASASAAPVDDAIDGEFAAIESFSLAEGKLLGIPKFKPADKDAAKAHAAALQSEFESIVKEGFKEQNRFNASFVPATYILMMHPERAEKPGVPGMPEQWVMLVAEGSNVTRELVAELHGVAGDKGSTDAFALMQTSRGYFIDPFGDGSLVYVLRRRGVPFTHAANDAPQVECIGKHWSPESGSVSDITVPDYPARGKDVDGDGKNEYPTQRFAFPLDAFAWNSPPSLDEVCNLPATGEVSIGVVGVASMIKDWSEKSEAVEKFYQHRLDATKKRVAKIRAWTTPVTRKSGELRFTNDCALDVAQTAAELYVYARTLGESEATAIAESDALMKGFALKPLSCRGIDRRVAFTGPPPEQGMDFWPELRKALLAAKIEAVAEPKPAAAPSTSASAAPSVSASAKP